MVGWGDNYMIPKGERVDSNLYVAGQQLTIIGNVSGDVWGGGGNVFVSNVIDGDAALIGGTINMVSTVSADVRLVGATIVVSGKIGGDLAAIGNNIRVIENTTVGGDALLAGNTIVFLAPVSGNVRISGANVSINSVINGNVRIIADKLHVGPNAVIKGSLSYKSVREAVIDKEAKIFGETHFEKVTTTGPDSGFLSFVWSSLFWVKFIALFVSSMILFSIGKKSMTLLARRVRWNPWQNLFAGFLFLIGVPISAVLLVITIIGLPLSGAVIGLGIIFSIVSIAFMPILVGTFIKILLKKGDSASWKAILLGSLIVLLLGLLPYVGFVVRAALFLASLGVLIRISLEKLQSIRA